MCPTQMLLLPEILSGRWLLAPRRLAISSEAGSVRRLTLGVVHVHRSQTELLERSADNGGVADRDDLEMLRTHVRPCHFEHVAHAYRTNVGAVAVEVVVRQSVRHQARECVRNCRRGLEPDREYAIQITRRQRELHVGNFE